MTAPTPADVPGQGEAEGLAQWLLTCDCGHWIGEHNGLGCYARLSYEPLTSCPCNETDDRHEVDLLAARLPDWLAERDAEVARAAKAEALREAAEYVTPKNWTGPNGTLIHLNHWLTIKAERLEGGKP